MMRLLTAPAHPVVSLSHRYPRLALLVLTLEERQKAFRKRECEWLAHSLNRDWTRLEGKSRRSCMMFCVRKPLWRIRASQLSDAVLAAVADTGEEKGGRTRRGNGSLTRSLVTGLDSTGTSRRSCMMDGVRKPLAHRVLSAIVIQH